MYDNLRPVLAQLLFSYDYFRANSNWSSSLEEIKHFRFLWTRPTDRSFSIKKIQLSIRIARGKLTGDRG